MRIDKEIQKRMWQLHRERVHKARCIVDQKAPSLHSSNYLRFGKLKEDGDTFIAMMKSNIGLLVNIGSIMTSHGQVHSFNDSEEMITSCRLKATRERLELIDMRNFQLGSRLAYIKPELNTRTRVMREQSEQQRQALKTFSMPTRILQKYERLDLPQCRYLAFKYLRPQVYLDLELKGLRKLGRLVIELYTEAAPQVVWEFVRVCSEHAHENFDFRRLFPLLWLDGEMRLSSKALARNTIEYDMRALSHGDSSGILSFPRDYLDGFMRGCLHFCISFKPLRVLDGRRVAFGRVTNGLRVIDFIRDFGMKNGKPTKPIGVQDCGLYL